MRSFFISLLTVISPWFCLAQEMTPAVTNMAGFNAVQGNSVVSISVGEPFVTTLTTKKAIITQGFLQPEILPCVDVAFSYYPNPAPKEIIVQAFGCEIKIQSMQLYSLWGQLLTSITPAKDNKVSLEGLPQGVYLLKIILSTGKTSTIKIVKEAP